MPEPAMTCRTCGATPKQRRDAVASSAIAYTCSRCLIYGRGDDVAIKRDMAAQGALGGAGPASEGHHTGAPKTGKYTPDNSILSDTIKRDIAPDVFEAGRGSRPGRPRLSMEQRRQRARDRQRKARGKPKSRLDGPDVVGHV